MHDEFLVNAVQELQQGSAFDSGTELTLIEKINYWVVEILFFPIVTVFENTSYEGTSGIAQYLTFYILNSMLWSIIFGYKLISTEALNSNYWSII